ncbi:hypothetical protein [Ornithinimicrobium kibberense]|uniref:hypothetical protein n=1 Tax=Ornithinimicrobium kibberense TaxID=282060 RepID=UPI0036235153
MRSKSSAVWLAWPSTCAAPRSRATSSSASLGCPSKSCTSASIASSWYCCLGSNLNSIKPSRAPRPCSYRAGTDWSSVRRRPGRRLRGSRSARAPRPRSSGAGHGSAWCARRGRPAGARRRPNAVPARRLPTQTSPL